MAQSSSDTGADTVDWKLDTTDSPLLQILAHVFPSIFGGVAVLVVGFFCWLVGTSLLQGDLIRAIGVVAVAFLALLSRRYLPALLATNLTDALWNRYSRRGLIIGSVVGALVLLGSAQVHPVAPFAVFISSWVPLVLTASFPTSGHADLSAETLVVDGTEIPLEAVSSFRATSVEMFAVCWLSYTRGVPTAPRLIVLPATHLEPVADLIDTVSASSKREHSTIDRTERVVAGLFGLGMIALGPVLWLVLPPGDGQAVALYAGAMFGLFGLLLLRYAYSA